MGGAGPVSLQYSPVLEQVSVPGYRDTESSHKMPVTYAFRQHSGSPFSSGLWEVQAVHSSQGQAPASANLSFHSWGRRRKSR